MPINESMSKGTQTNNSIISNHNRQVYQGFKKCQKFNIIRFVKIIKVVRTVKFTKVVRAAKSVLSFSAPPDVGLEVRRKVPRDS